jgi:hypothetical protein
VPPVFIVSVGNCHSLMNEESFSSTSQVAALFFKEKKKNQ